MVVITTKEKFIIYGIDSAEFDNIVTNCSKKQIREIVFAPMNSVLKDIVICFTSKENFTDNLINQLQSFGYDLAAIKEYYHFDGETFIKREISNIYNIIDENDIVPTAKYNNYIFNPTIDEKYRSLIELDYKLNNCTHISRILSNDRISEFIRFYSIDSSREENKYFYEITPMSKLIVRKNNKKLTANELENNVFVLMAPAGINDDGDVTYFINEYLITAEDIQSIKNIFTGLLKKDEVKASDISEKERYMYYNRAVIQHVFNVREQLGNQSNSLLSSKPKTWQEYKAEFLNKYGYTVADVNADGWIPGDIITLDARTIKNGTIVPAIIDDYETKEKRSDEIVSKDELGFTTKDPLSDDSRKDIKRLFAGKNIDHLITQLPKQEFFRVPETSELEEDDLFDSPVGIEQPAEQTHSLFSAPGDLESKEEDDLFTSPVGIEQPAAQTHSLFSTPGDLELVEEDLFVTLEGTKKPATSDMSLFRTPQPSDLGEEDDLFASPVGIEQPKPQEKKLSTEDVLKKFSLVGEDDEDFDYDDEELGEEEDLFTSPVGIEKPVVQEQGVLETSEPEEEDLFASPVGIEKTVVQEQGVLETSEPEEEDLFASPVGIEKPVVQKQDVSETSEPEEDWFQIMQRVKKQMNQEQAVPETSEPEEEDLFASPVGIEGAVAEPRFIDLDVSTNKYIIDGKYTVEPGDTLSFIASRFGIGESYLRTINDLDDDKLIPGQELIIPSIVPETADIKRFDSNNGQKKFILDESDSEEIEGDRPFLISKKKFLLSEEDLKVNEINNKINQFKRSFKHISELNNKLNALLSKTENILDTVLFQKQADIIVSYEQLENKFNKIVYDYQKGFTNAADIMQRLETCESEISELEQKYADCFELAEKRQTEKKSSTKPKQETPEFEMTETLRDRYIFDGEDFVESSGHKKM